MQSSSPNFARRGGPLRRGYADHRRNAEENMAEKLEGSPGRKKPDAATIGHNLSKIKKDGQPVSLALEPTIDILARVAARPKPPFCVGFAAETDDVVPNAEAKRRSKNVPLLVANRAQDALGSDENQVTLIDQDGAHPLPRMDKVSLARRLVAEVAARLSS